MRLFRHKKYQTVFKGLLVVLYFTLLGSQLSHKFYICANFSARIFKGCHCKIAHTRPSIHNASTQLNYPKSPSLTLDKRYELKPIFALLSPAFVVDHILVDGQKEFNVFCQVFIHVYGAHYPLRGPPAA